MIEATSKRNVGKQDRYAFVVRNISYLLEIVNSCADMMGVRLWYSGCHRVYLFNMK